MKNTVTYLILSLGLVASVSGCRKDVNNSETMHELVIVSVPAQQTKATGSGGNLTVFDIGDKLGVFVVNTKTSTIQEENVMATYAKGDDATLDKWNLEKPILLTGEEVIVTGYFPHIEGAVLTAIPLTSGTHNVNTNDVVTLQKLADGLTNYELRLENMKHAMTRVKIKLKIDPAFTPGRYTGAGKVTNITIADNKASNRIYQTGLLDVSNVIGTTPTIHQENAGDVKIATDYTMTPTLTKVFDVLLLPVADITGDAVKFVFEIDGRMMDIPVPSVEVQAWESGKAYNYDFTVKELGISFVKVTASPWEDVGNVQQVAPPVVLGQFVDGGIVFWIDPDNAKHYKVMSLFEPATATLADAQKYATEYGAGWRFMTTDEGRNILIYSFSNVQENLTKYAGMVLQRAFYWVEASATNAYNIIRDEEATQPVDSKCNVRLVKEITTP